MSLPLRFRVWVCGGQKTISSGHIPSAAWARDGRPFVMIRSPSKWSSFLAATEGGVAGCGNPILSPRWLCRETDAGEAVEMSRLEASVVASAAADAPAVPLADLVGLVGREFPGVDPGSVIIEAQWSCSESGSSLGALPRRALGAVLRLTGPTDEPDGYREIPPA